jgi:hypothetical protein
MTTKTKKAPAATAGAKAKKSVAPTFVLRRGATDELPASYLGADAIPTEVSDEAKRFRAAADALAWRDRAVHFSEHARWAPVEIPAAPAPVTGFILQLASVDGDEGSGGAFLDDLDAYTTDIACAQRFATRDDACAWIAEHTDHVMNEVWQVIDLAANVDEPADPALEAEVAQDDAWAPEWCVKSKHVHEFLGQRPDATDPAAFFVERLDHAMIFASEADALAHRDAVLAKKAQRHWEAVALTPATLAQLRAAETPVDPDAPVEDARAYTPAAETMVQGDLLPPDAGTAPVEPVETTGLELDAPGQARLVALALSRFAADLGKLAKSERDLGRTAEAASAERDAKLIREELLAQLEPQAQLPFGYSDLRGALAARVAGKFRARLTNEIRRSTPVLADEQTQDREARIKERIADFEELVGSAADITVSLVEPIVREAAERGMVAGRLARETTAASIGCEAVAAVERDE